MVVTRVRVIDRYQNIHDGMVRSSNHASVETFLDGLRDRGFADQPVRVNGRPVTGLQRVSDLRLVHGATIEVGSSGYEPCERAFGRYLVAVSGPAAGSWWRLPATGRVVVGRGAGCDAEIADGLVSTQHLAVAATDDGAIIIEDLGSSNGTTLEDAALTAPTEVALGAYIQVGSTVLTVLEVTAGDLPVEASPSEGARPFQRHYREALDPLPEKLLPPDAPDDRDGASQRMWWQYLLPMATGIGFALMTGRWIFLLIMAISPIAMLANFLIRRRRDQASKAATHQDYERRAAEHRAEVARVEALERHRRRRAAVVGGEAVLMAELRHRRLWERGVDDDDYLEVCVGLARQLSQVQTTSDDERRSLWAVPLSVSLAQTGSLLVQGRMDRARAVGRSMLLNLAATHSPADLQISVLTTEECEGDWNWARWLPHTFVDGGATRIYTTNEQRASAMTAVTRQIEARESGAGGPAHVIIVDGADHVDSARLTTILARSGELGIHGIVLDTHVTPEGVRGTLTLGEHPDEGSFVSRHVARVSGILTAELDVGWAERAAQVMAGLRPSAADTEGLDAAEVHLTDLLGAGSSLAADWVRGHWASSPSEQVVVGLAGRTPVEVDIVRHGPHAIVGGATRSGKTEFLLTWLTAMCLSNTPDDLAIIVADFKGGVDHVQTAKLPHVISLVTNQDIRAFERTMVMLEAEIERRQEVLSAAGTSNIEAYRAARARDGSLAAVPRLLVVVDEFSELRQADKDSGRGYMARLESIARVGAGLGVHLVLVTQNFSGGQLSDQIEGQVGMGVCFRVEKGEHSKVVLANPVASTIPASRPGRGWARLRGADLVEFQCARVAGRRRDLVGDARVDLELVPFTALCAGGVQDSSGAVPHDETDLAVLIDVINEANEGRPSPVPWPDDLSPSLHLADVVGRGQDREIPIGVADVPERQHQHPIGIADTDEQVLIVSSSSNAASRALVTYATSVALHRTPTDAHQYAIDLEGNTLQALDQLPHVGAVACLDDDLAMRIVDLVRQEASRRRSLFESAGATDLREYQRVSGETLPTIRLLISGADRLTTSPDGNANPLLGPVSSLAVDSPGTGVGLIMAGTLSLVGKRLTQRADRRMVMRCNDPSDYAVVGAPRDKAVELEPAGRAWDVVRSRLVQWANVASPDAVLSEVLAALGRELEQVHGPRPANGWPNPLPEVRWPVPWDRIDETSIRIPPGYQDALPVGIDTSSAFWAWIEAEEDGPLVAIGGPSRSGRSTALIVLAHLARQAGWQVQAVVPTRRSPLHALADLGVSINTGLAGVEPASKRTVYLIDDIHRLTDTDNTGLIKVLEESTAPHLVVMTGPVEQFGTKMGVLRSTPDIRTSVTLAPTGTLGVGNMRLPDHLRVDPRPGRGALWTAGEFTGIQVPMPPGFSPAA